MFTELERGKVQVAI